MTSNKRKKRLLKDLRDKRQRDAFVSAQIDTGIPFQIKVLREQKPWTQKELGEHISPPMDQVRISVLEDPNYGNVNLKTLKRLASAFDVGLVVKFVPFSELVEWELNLDSESLKVLSFADEPYFKEIGKVTEPDIKQDETKPLPKALATVDDLIFRVPIPNETYVSYNTELEKCA